MGEGDKGPRGAEANIKVKARRGLYAACDIAAGEILVESKILALRPTAAVNAEQIDRIVGRQSPLAIAAGKPLPASLVAAGIP
jgi:sialic acid synthase SpsE